MKLIFSAILNPELKEYLLTQNGVVSVDFTLNDLMTEANIEFSEGTNPIIIMKHIELFQKYKYPCLFEFDKGNKGNFKTLKYVVDEICCEYCFHGLIMDLFENEKIKSVTSNFDLAKRTINTEIIVEYKDYNEQEVVDLINQSLGRKKV